MNTWEDFKRIASQRIITLANDVLADFSGNKRIFEQYDNPYDNPEFKNLAELEQEFRKLGKTDDSCASDHLRDFCIDFDYIPDRLYKLMQKLDWLDDETHAPKPYLSGFYSSSYHDFTNSPRTTKTTYFCTIDRYIQLLISNAELEYFYKDQQETVIEEKPRSVYDCHFSNGMQYVHPVDRGHYKGLTKDQYYAGFTERDQFLDDAIQRGTDLHLGCNLWRIYDDAVNSCGINNPINPYDWLFKHVTFNDKSIVISKPNDRILLLSGTKHIEFYDFIHGNGAYSERYGRPVN